MSIDLATPEASPTRVKADFFYLGINRDTQTAVVGVRVTAADGSNPREFSIRITGSTDFNSFLQAASIDRRAIEQWIADNRLPGAVT